MTNARELYPLSTNDLITLDDEGTCVFCTVIQVGRLVDLIANADAVRYFTVVDNLPPRELMSLFEEVAHIQATGHASLESAGGSRVETHPRSLEVVVNRLQQAGLKLLAGVLDRSQCRSLVLGIVPMDRSSCVVQVGY